MSVQKLVPLPQEPFHIITMMIQIEVHPKFTTLPNNCLFIYNELKNRNNYQGWIPTSRKQQNKWLRQAWRSFYWGLEFPTWDPTIECDV